MKPEDQAWRELQQYAAAHLRPDFSQRVLRATQGPSPAAWQQLQACAAAQLRPGFAARVLRAARLLPRMPSLVGQVALSAATAALCLLGVVAVHAHNTRVQERHNLAVWQQLASEVQDIEPGQ